MEFAATSAKKTIMQSSGFLEHSLAISNRELDTILKSQSWHAADPGRDGVPDRGTAGGPVARAVHGDLGSVRPAAMHRECTWHIWA